MVFAQHGTIRDSSVPNFACVGNCLAPKEQYLPADFGRVWFPCNETPNG